VEAKQWVRGIIENPRLVKVLQNGLYDIQYFKAEGMNPRAFREDTMIAHHSLYSEQRKGLGFLGSIYANVPSWKHMRTYKQEELTKRDD
jgi:DNA polymerase I-like protein with 3'-5' exonuclease and polymerase domains